VLPAPSVPISYEEDSWSNQVTSVREAVKRGVESGSLRISTVRSRYQGTADEDTAGWKILSRCCGDL
jgi:hypothetical protein